MYYVYFIFAGYRVAIGKTQDLRKRISDYQRTHFDVFCLGVISCKTDKESLQSEQHLLKRFSKDNAFRDMFYLSNDIKDFIVNETITPNYEILGYKIGPHLKIGHEEKKRKRYLKQREKKGIKTPYNPHPKTEEERRDRRRESSRRYYAKNKEKRREYYRKYNAPHRKTRPVSPHTLDLF